MSSFDHDAAYQAIRRQRVLAGVAPTHAEMVEARAWIGHGEASRPLRAVATIEKPGMVETIGDVFHRPLAVAVAYACILGTAAAVAAQFAF